MNNVKNYNKSAVFMVIEKAVKMISQLCMLILLAKFLGPEDLGSLMYCFSIASIFLCLNQLGLENVIIKYFVEKPNEKYTLLKNTLVLRLISGLLCVGIINTLGLWFVDGANRELLLIISLYHIFMPINIFDWYFQSQGRGDFSALGLIFGHVLGFLFRVICLYLNAELIWFGIAYIFESFIMAAAYIVLSRVNQVKLSSKLSLIDMKLLLKESAPLILSGAIVLLYMKVDQIMLGNMISDSEVGIYVAATRLSEAWYFLGLTIISAYFPKFMSIRINQSEEAYNSAIVNMGRLLVWCAIVLATITTFISPWLISMLYGDDYARSAQILMITVWAIPFVYLGSISTKMFVVLSKTKNILWRSISGLCINLILNYYMIPIYGAIGAAISTLISQIVASYLWNCFYLSSKVFKLQTSIIFPFVSLPSK